MKKQKGEVKKFKFSYADLKQLSDEVRGYAARDAAEFAGRGIDAQHLTDVEMETEAFADFPTDEEYLSNLIIATDARNASRGQLYKWVSMIRNMADVKWKKDNPVLFRKYEFGSLSQMDDNEFYRVAKRAKRIAEGDLALLSSEGLDQVKIDALQAAIVDFDAKIDEQNMAISERDIATQTRAVMANELYDKIERICSVGKNIFYDNNEAKYNDYVISRLVGEGSSGENVLEEYEDFLAPGASMDLGTVPEGAKDIRLQVFNTGGIEFGFSSDGTTFSGDTATVNGPGSSTVAVSQFGTISATTLLLLKNLHAMNQLLFKVTVLG